MSVEVGTAYLTVVPSAKGFAGKLQSELGGGMAAAGTKAGNAASKSFGTSFKSGVSTAAKAGALAVAGALALGVGFAKSAIAEARESQKVGALTENVIRSTGGAAKVTAAQVGDLATAISNKTGIDDEQIQSGANMLLTFKNIRNEAGKGNDIFNQSTQILTDLATAMGTDPQKAAIQLGKALNDPIKGVSALSRVGVTFTEQQKKTIKSLVDGGKTAEAQKIILKELNSEFGGAAEASATAGEKLSTAFGNFKENIGTSLLPTLDRLEGFLTTRILPGAQQVIDVLFNGDFKGGGPFSEDSPVIDVLFKLRDAFGVVKKAVSDFFAGLTLKDAKSIGAPLEGFVAVGQKVRKAIGSIRDTVVKLWPTVKEIFGNIATVAKNLVADFTGMAGGMGGAESAGSTLADTLGRVVDVIASVTGWLAKNSTVVSVVVGAVLAGVAAFKTITAVARAYAAVQTALNVILSANPIGLVVIAVAALVAGLIIAYKKSETFRNIVNDAFSVVKEGALRLASVAVGAFRMLLNFYLTMVGALVNGAAKAFGWVPGLGPKLKTAAAKFNTFKDETNAALAKVEKDLKIKADTTAAQRGIDQLRREAQKPITVEVFMKTKYTAGRVNVAGVGPQNAGNRASGGPVSAGSPYWVGENPDGSLNRTSELFVPKTSGTVYNQAQLAGMGRGLSHAEIQALVAALESANLRADISAGTFDRAMGATLR